jgi:hypothetical protein
MGLASIWRLGARFILASLLVIVSCYSQTDTKADERPRLRAFAFASRPQDRNQSGGACLRFAPEPARSNLEGDVRSSVRCLMLAIRLGCGTADVYQDLSVAKLAMNDLKGALQDVRHALLLAGCRSDVAGIVSQAGCPRPELLLNYASLLDKAFPEYPTLARIQHLLRSYVRNACRTSESGALACSARGAIVAIVEMWRLGQLSFGNWDTWEHDKWLLTAAVNADVQRCRSDALSNRFSVVQPWEVSDAVYACKRSETALAVCDPSNHAML